MSPSVPTASNGESPRNPEGLTSESQSTKPLWRRIISSLGGWKCYGWHAACPTTRAERRRALASDSSKVNPLLEDDDPVNTANRQSKRPS